MSSQSVLSRMGSEDLFLSKLTVVVKLDKNWINVINRSLYRELLLEIYLWYIVYCNICLYVFSCLYPLTV